MNNKLPTAEQLYETAFYDKSYDSQHGFINMKQRVVHIVESHTQAHTAGLQSDVEHNANIAIEAAKERDELQERVKELEEAIEYLYMCFKRDGVVASDFDKAKKAMRKEALK